ncbi:tetratricopeptide repeat protein [Amycolatopsis magusensis]|uniref:tetratricopeptide repeat protein n=1 Tax=Amycolatopsis magusensis TaxID=882444 RepID=UPI0024A8A48A|nr:tetratricopeptide repeat protein [Amycolatopsis magusensis]MDI5979191.1 tetratricopeptide repeat protein [Amycolatopsis magusensis]
MGGPVAAEQIVEVLAEQAGGRQVEYRKGSGLLVSGALVLTAAHNVSGRDARLTVRSAGIEYSAAVVAAGGESADTDIAVLEIDDPAFRRVAPPIEFFAIDRLYLRKIVNCKAVGFPLFGEKRIDGTDRIRRDSVQVYGSVNSGSGLKSRLLTLLVDDHQPEAGEDRSSSWRGMSGAAVIVEDPTWGEGVIGLVVEHPLRYGPTALTVVPITNLERALGRAAVRVWSLLGVTDASRFPRVPSEARLPVQRRSVDVGLEPPLADFTGHGADLHQLVDAVLGGLALGGRPVVVVSGMAGVGKTTLATQVAHQLADRFHHARLVVRLNGQEADEATVSRQQQRLLRALGVSDDQVREVAGRPDDQQDLYLSKLDAGPSLVIVDDPAGEDDVARFMPRRPGSVVVVTSRTVLPDIDGAVQVRLKPFSDGESLIFLAGILGRERVSAEPEAARRILASAGGLPLAIRLIGAFAASAAGEGMPLEEIASMMAEEGTRLDRLSRKGRSVRATIFVSYRHLTPPTAVFFRRICLLGVPDFSRVLAASATGSSTVETIAALSELTDAHLVEHVRGDRYRVHDLVRLFGDEVARAEEAPETVLLVRERWRRFYLEAAERWDDELTAEGERPSPAALAWFDVEEANVVATLVAASAAQDWEVVFGLAVRLRPPLAYRGRFREYAEIASAGIEAAERGRFADRALGMLVHLAEARRYSDRTDGVDELYERAEALATAAGDVDKQTWIGVHRGIFAMEQGQLGVTMGHYDRVDESYRERSDDGARVWLSGHYIDAHLTLGQPAPAVERGELALDLSLRLDDPDSVAWAHKHLARALQAAGRYPEAIDHMTRSMERAEQTGDVGARVDCLRRLGWIARDAGDLDAAEDYLEQALQGAEAADIQFLIEELGVDLRDLRAHPPRR